MLADCVVFWSARYIHYLALAFDIYSMKWESVSIQI